MKPHRYYGTDFAKNHKRSLAGKEAKKAGESFEDRLNTEHDLYRVQGKAIIKQLHKATGGYGESMYIKGKAPIDFAGNLCDARAVYIEAKSTALLESGNPSGTLGINDSRLSPEQVVELVDRARMGCLCLVLWWNGVQCGVFRVTQDWFDKGIGTGIKADQFEWLPVGSIDWLSVVPNHPTGLAALAANKERMLAGMEIEKLKGQIRVMGGVI